MEDGYGLFSGRNMETGPATITSTQDKDAGGECDPGLQPVFQLIISWFSACDELFIWNKAYSALSLLFETCWQEVELFMRYRL